MSNKKNKNLESENNRKNNKENNGENNSKNNSKNNGKNNGNLTTHFEMIIFSFLIIIIVLSSVIIARNIKSNPSYPFEESYYNLRMSYVLSEDFFIKTDPVQGNPYEANPYHYFLALLLILLPDIFVTLFLPIVMGLLSAFLFFKIITEIKIDNQIAVFSVMLLAVMPVFITMFTTLSSVSFVVFLSLLAIYLFVCLMNNSNNYFSIIFKFFSVIVLILLLFTSLTAFFITLAAIFAGHIILKKSFRTILIPVTVSCLLAVFSWLFNYADFGFNNHFFHGFDFKNILSILNAPYGFDFFLLVIFFLGFVISWTSNRKINLIHLVVLLFTIFSLFNTLARSLVIFVMSIYCVKGIIYLYEREWDLDLIRKGSLILIFCSILFSGLNQINLLTSVSPDQEFHDALFFLSGLTPGVVLSSQENGFFIEYYSQKQVLIDQNSIKDDNYAFLLNISEELFKTSWIKDAAPLLEKSNIKYVLLTPSIKENLWNNKVKGLWFLMTYSGHFKNIYNQNNIEVWEYLPD